MRYNKRDAKIELIRDHEKFFNEIFKNDIAKQKTKKVIISVYNIYERKEKNPFKNIDKIKDFCKKNKKKFKIYCGGGYCTPETVPKNIIYVEGLHSKVYWFVGYGVYIGSANCTEYGWHTNLECGVWIPSEKLESYHIKEDLESFFNSLERYKKTA